MIYILKVERLDHFTKTYIRTDVYYFLKYENALERKNKEENNSDVERAWIDNLKTED